MPTYLLRDDFLTDAAAPLTSPRPCEPGPGTLTLDNTAADYSIVSGRLVLNPSSVTACRAYADYARVSGRAVIIQKAASGNNNSTYGWRTTGNQPLGVLAQSLRIQTSNDYLHSDCAVADGDFVWSILRAAGSFVGINSRLLWVDATDADATVRGGHQGTNHGEVIETLRIADLGSPWTSEGTSVATSYMAGARAPADAFTHIADCLIYFKVTTLPASGNVDFRFRISNSTNYWQVTVDSTGALTLNEVVAGAATARGTAAGVVSAGERIGIICYNESIQVYDATERRINYTTAVNFKTATSGLLNSEGTSGAVETIEAWPRVLSGSPYTVLSAFFEADSQAGTTHYVSVAGGATGLGTIADPWTFTQMEAKYLRPGSLVNVLGDGTTFTGDLWINGGTAADPVTLTVPVGKRITIDGQLKMGAAASRSYAIVEGFEVTDSSFTDRSSSNSDDGVEVGEGLILRRCNIKNHNQGVTGGAAVIDYTIADCLFYYNGWDANLGHGLYCQHALSTGLLRLTRNVVYNNFAFGFHIYGGNSQAYITATGNFAFDNGQIRSEPCRAMLFGGTAGIDNITITRNVAFNSGNQDAIMVGWGTGNPWNDIVVNGGNYFIGFQAAIRLQEAVTLETDFQGNYIYGPLEQFSSSTFPNNTYSTYALRPALAIVEGCDYAEIANVFISNPSSAASVSVSLASLGWSGAVRVRNVQDFWTDVTTLTILNGSITIDMQAASHTVETPVGWTAPTKTFPLYGAFRLELVEAGTVAMTLRSRSRAGTLARRPR